MVLYESSDLYPVECAFLYYYNSGGHIACSVLMSTQCMRTSQVVRQQQVRFGLTKLRAISTPHKEQSTGLLSHSPAS